MTSNSIIWFLLDLKPSWQKKLLSQFEGNPCNISSQDVSKFTYLTLDEYISEWKMYQSNFLYSKYKFPSVI